MCGRCPAASSVARSISTGRAGLHADTAGARAAYPPRQGDLQHLHQPGSADDRRRRCIWRSWAPRDWRASPPPARRAPRELVGRAEPRCRVCAARSRGAHFHEAVLHARSAGGARCSRRSPRAAFRAAWTSSALLSRARLRAAGVRHRDQDAAPTSSVTRSALSEVLQPARARARSGRRHRRHAHRPRSADLRVLARRSRRERPVAAGARGARRLADMPPQAARARARRSLPEVRELEAVRHFTRLSQLQLLDRHALLSARLLHDEVQPQGLQRVRDAAGVPGAPSARARDRTARDSSPACTSCRRCSRRSRACAAWRFARWPARTANSPASR